MNRKNDRADWPNLSPAEIDDIVIAQADDDSAWEDYLEVDRQQINNTKTENNAHQKQRHPN